MLLSHIGPGRNCVVDESLRVRPPTKSNRRPPNRWLYCLERMWHRNRFAAGQDRPRTAGLSALGRAGLVLAYVLIGGGSIGARRIAEPRGGHRNCAPLEVLRMLSHDSLFRPKGFVHYACHVRVRGAGEPARYAQM